MNATVDLVNYFVLFFIDNNMLTMLHLTLLLSDMRTPM